MKYHNVSKSAVRALGLAALCLMLPLARPATGIAQQSAPSTSSEASLDYAFFKARVQPILLAKRPGHARCISCHKHNNQMRLQPLPTGSTTWNEEESRKNFEAVRRTVVPGSLQSRLLVHPLAEAAGGDFYHGGGKHWDSQSEAEWQTLKAWVLGQTSK
jgi:hypothetical protein